MLRWLILSTLLVTNIIALWLPEELEDQELWQRGRPSPGTPPPTFHSECVKDILIVWDNSQSVGLQAFQDNVLPFLKRLITSHKLNVGREGTNLGIISFSSEERTNTLLKIDRRTPEELTAFLDGLAYQELMGGWTYTGKAFQIADNTFNRKSPLNHRPEIADIILLFTDGEPRARTRKLMAEQRYLAEVHSASLKNKDVKIIGLGIGRQGVLDKFLPYIEMWSSEGSVFTADLAGLDNVIDQLVADTCKPAGHCGCDGIIPDTQFAKKGEKVAVDWIQPTMKCSKNNPSHDVTIIPQGTKPGLTLFGIGKHTVTYRFRYNDAGRERTLDCPISITVAECDCPNQQKTVVGVIGPNQDKGLAKWKIPVPSCEARMINPPMKEPVPSFDERQFGEGEHRVQYVYQHRSGRNSFQLTCGVNIKMEACRCNLPSQTVTGRVETGTKGKASWQEPTLSCAATADPNNPKSTEGMFAVGQHTLTYRYTYGENSPHSFVVECDVNIDMKGEFCGKTTYDPATHTCCCGKVYRKQYGHDCCGLEYYNTRDQQCCNRERAHLAPKGQCPYTYGI